jgi:hypothetical protein
MVILYEGNTYLGKTISLNEENIYISAMVEGLKSWKKSKKPVKFLNVSGVTC